MVHGFIARLTTYFIAIPLLCLCAPPRAIASTLSVISTGNTTLAAGSTSTAASVAMLNNGGDIGKTLDQLGKQESVKSVLTSMLTAGALDKLGTSLEFNSITAQSSFAANVGKNAINNLTSASMDAALNGNAFNEESLSKALSSALIAAGAAKGANAIGDAASANNSSPAQINAFTQTLAHAMLGCAAGTATTGSTASGCAPGVVGAVVGELSAQFYNPDGTGNKTDTLNFAKVMASVAGALSGGGVEAVNVAALTGGNAAENNYLKHAERIALKNAQRACFADASSSACDTVTALKRKDELSERLLANAVATCTGSECNDVSNYIMKEMRALGCAVPNACPDMDTLNSYWAVVQTKAQGLQAVYPEGWVLDAKAVLDVAKFGVRLLSGTSTGANGSLDALKALGKTDAALAEANFSAKLSGFNETTPLKDFFGKSPNTSALSEHLSTGGPSIPKSGVSGAHSDAAFKDELASIKGVEVAPSKTLAPGITEYNYNTPERIATGKTPLTKTTYDSTYTDTQILEMSKKASSEAWTDFQKNGIVSTPDNPVYKVINGIPFKVNFFKDKAGNITIYSHPGSK